MVDSTKAAGGRREVDLRSDTVTTPSQGMRNAMAAAEVGDDVYGDDPTIVELEQRVASLLGKESALFVTSGTQSNLVALLTHCGRGDEYIGGVGTHIAKYEAAGAAVLGGISPRHISLNENGGLDAAHVEAAVQPDDPHFAVSRLICVENTWNGKVVPQADMDAIADVAETHGLSLHFDGARLMNAAIATGRPAQELVTRMDSVSLCLSKGLGAPVGSVLVGSSAFIAKARRNRKLLGGGLRQAGVLAACGLYALDHNVDRLADDHANARDLAGKLIEIEGVALAQPVQTNMIWLKLDTLGKPPLVPFLTELGIVVSPPGSDGGLRLVTHLDFHFEQIDTVAQAFAEWCEA